MPRTGVQIKIQRVKTQNLLRQKMTAAQIKKFPIKITKSVSCKQCVYLEKDKLDGKFCKDVGVVETSKTCSSYKVNVHDMRSASGHPEIGELFKAIKNIKDAHLPLIASILIGEEKTRKFTKYKVMQPVVIRYNGTGEYLADYCRAYMLDADAENMRFINKAGTMIAQFPLDTTSIFSLKDFAAIKDTLKKKKFVREKVFIDDTIPTIDQVVKEEKIPKKNLRKIDLFSLFKEIQ